MTYMLDLYTTQRAPKLKFDEGSLGVSFLKADTNCRRIVHAY
jgi:hypothetical protein